MRTIYCIVLTSFFKTFCCPAEDYVYPYYDYDTYEFYDTWHMTPRDCLTAADYHKHPLCFPDNATALPGVLWKQIEDNWANWWEYPCFYYTEQALLSVTDENIDQYTFLCEGDYFWFQNGIWYKNRHWNFAKPLDVNDSLTYFFNKNDNQC